MTQISHSVQLDENKKLQFESDGVMQAVYSRIQHTEALDRDNFDDMTVLIHNVKLFLKTPKNHIVKDNAWEIHVSKYMKFLQYRQNRSKLDLLKLENHGLHRPG